MLLLVAWVLQAPTFLEVKTSLATDKSVVEVKTRRRLKGVKMRSVYEANETTSKPHNTHIVKHVSSYMLHDQSPSISVPASRLATPFRGFAVVLLVIREYF